MKTSSKGKSEMLGRMQWRTSCKGKSEMLGRIMHLANLCQKCLGRMQCKSEMLGRMQWKHLAKVSQKC